MTGSAREPIYHVSNSLRLKTIKLQGRPGPHLKYRRSRPASNPAIWGNRSIQQKKIEIITEHGPFPHKANQRELNQPDPIL